MSHVKTYKSPRDENNYILNTLKGFLKVKITNEEVTEFNKYYDCSKTDNECKKYLENNHIYKNLFRFTNQLHDEMSIRILKYLNSRYNFLVNNFLGILNLYFLFYHKLLKDPRNTLSDIEKRDEVVRTLYYKTIYYVNESLGKFIMFMSGKLPYKNDSNINNITEQVNSYVSDTTSIKENDEIALNNVNNYFIEREKDTNKTYPVIKEYMSYCKTNKAMLHKLNKHNSNPKNVKISSKHLNETFSKVQRNINILKRLNLSIQMYTKSLVINIELLNDLDFKRTRNN
jgi:hypothetical protein